MSDQASVPLRGRPIVDGFFEKRTSSIQYVVADPETKRCAIIDPVHDFDPKSGGTATHSADALLAHVERKGYTHRMDPRYAPPRRPFLDGGIPQGQGRRAHGNRRKSGRGAEALEGTVQFARELPDGRLAMGPAVRRRRALHDRQHGCRGDAHAGHTLASIAYLVGDAAFIHDTIFMPDGGTSRADFPGGSARVLWKSIQRIMALPDETRLFTGHDYMPGGREPRWESTVGQQRRDNIHVRCKTEDDFVAVRQGRDQDMPMPKLILHSLQVNIRGGRLPEPEKNGRRYLKIPLDALKNADWGD